MENNNSRLAHDNHSYLYQLILASLDWLGKCRKFDLSPGIWEIGEDVRGLVISKGEKILFHPVAVSCKLHRLHLNINTQFSIINLS